MRPKRLLPSAPVRAAVALLVGLSGCAAGSGLPPLPPVAPQAAYHLGSGDTVRVIVFGEEHLTGQFRVSDGGRIAVPLVCDLQAAGLTTAGLADELSHELQARKLIVQPSVSVEVVTYRPIFVLGEVVKPGEYPYQPGMTMLTAVAVAGGFTYRAVQARASAVRHTTGGEAQEGAIGRQSLLQPGDVVTVFERWF